MGDGAPMNGITLSATLTVRDLGAAERFYAEVIGLHPSSRGPGHVAMGAGGVPFLHLRHDPAATPDDPAGTGLFHLAVLLPSRADLGGWLRHAGATGTALDGAADHGVSEAAYLHDPEGNGVEVYADRPRDAWTWDGPQLRLVNDRLDHAALRAGAAPWHGAPPGTRLGHVHLRVGNVGAAVRFATGQLGLQVMRQGAEAAFLSWEGYHHHLAVNTWRSRGAGPRAPGMAGLDRVTVHGASALPRSGGTIYDPSGLPFHLEP